MSIVKKILYKGNKMEKQLKQREEQINYGLVNQHKMNQ